MVTSLGTDESPQLPLMSRSFPREVARVAASAAFIAWFVSATILFVRCWSAEPMDEPAAWQVLLASIINALLALLIREAWRDGASQLDGRSAGRWTLIPASLIAASLASAVSNWPLIAWPWLCVVASQWAGEIRWQRPPIARTQRTEPTMPDTSTRQPIEETRESSESPNQLSSNGDGGEPVKVENGDNIEEEQAAEDEAELEVTQRWIRSKARNGTESLAGTVMVHFAQGESFQRTHVGFCPPLARSPMVYVETADGPPCEVRVAQSYEHGARIDLQLDEACIAPEVVKLQIYAIVEPLAGGSATEYQA